MSAEPSIERVIGWKRSRRAPGVVQGWVTPGSFRTDDRQAKATADDLLAWLRDRGSFNALVAIADNEVTVEVWVGPDHARYSRHVKGSTLFAALEAAVRAVIHLHPDTDGVA